MLCCIPVELIIEIINNLNLIDKKSLILINIPAIVKKNIIKEFKSLTLIQRFYKKNLPRLPVCQHYNPMYDSIYNKKMMVRQYIASYPMNYLVNLPESYLDKLTRSHWSINPSNNSIETLQELSKFKEDILPNDPLKRSRRDILKFLNHSKITKEGLRYVGW